MRALVTALALALAGPVAAQSLVELRSELDNLLNQLGTYEVTVEGEIGSLVGNELYFRDGSGLYGVTLAVGRETLRELENCTLAPYHGSKSTCRAVGKAEVKFRENTVYEGYTIELLLFDLEVVTE